MFDADDTTLWTYDMEVADMHFNFNPAEQDIWVQGQRFPATPAMVAFVNKAKKIGYTIFGLTGRNDNQKAATVANLAKVGYDPKAFVAERFYTKWTGHRSVHPALVHHLCRHLHHGRVQGRHPGAHRVAGLHDRGELRRPVQ